MGLHNITRGVVEHGFDAPQRARLSVISTSHNMSSGLRSRNVMPSGASPGGTGVLIANLLRKALRQQMVQAPMWRGKPFYSRYTLPASLERLEIADLLGQIQRPAIAKVQSRPHAGGL